MILYVEFEDEFEGQAKLQENLDYLGFPRPHTLNCIENPNIPWDSSLGSLMTNPYNIKVAKEVDLDAIYNGHSYSPMLLWKPHIFDDYQLLTEAEIAAKGYFEEEEF